MPNSTLDKRAIQAIEDALRRGNVVEVKKERGFPVVVEITRKAKYKAIEYADVANRG